MNDTELKELLGYCQSDERICPNPYYWEGVFKRFRGEESYMRDTFPPNPLILGGWWASDDDEKRLRFLTHIYWAYTHNHNLFEQTKRYIECLDGDKWYRYVAHEVTLDEVKEEYEKWKNQ